MSVYSMMADQYGYSYDKATNTLYGEKNGFKFAVRNVSAQFELFLSVRYRYETAEGNLVKDLKQNVKTIQSGDLKQYKLGIFIKGGMTNKKTCQNIADTVEGVSYYLATHEYVPCCEVSGETEDVSCYVIADVVNFLSSEEYNKRVQNLDEKSQQYGQKKENIFLGIFGALLGSLIGVLAIVIVGQLGYVSMYAGLIMGLCTIMGYKLLSGKITIKGVVISLGIVILMTHVANSIDWSFTIVRYFANEYQEQVSVFEVVPEMLNLRLVMDGMIDMASYLRNLGLLMLFTFGMSAITAISALKGEKRQFNIRKLM